MELIEIVKSSIIFFSLGLIILVIFAFLFVKVRNRAKEEKDLSPRVDNLNIRNLSPVNSQASLISPGLKDKAKHVTELNYKKFEVINDKVEPTTLKNIPINYHSNVYKYYEEFDSKMMFKLKVEAGNHT